MVEVQNGRTANLVLPNFHEGQCSTHDGSPLKVAFRPNIALDRPERQIGATALLDGAAYRVVSIQRSRFTAGYFIAQLEPVV